MKKQTRNTYYILNTTNRHELVNGLRDIKEFCFFNIITFQWMKHNHFSEMILLCWAMAAIHGQPSNSLFCEKTEKQNKSTWKCKNQAKTKQKPNKAKQKQITKRKQSATIGKKQTKQQNNVAVGSCRFFSLLYRFIFAFFRFIFAFVSFFRFFPRRVQQILLTGKSSHKCRSGTRKKDPPKKQNKCKNKAKKCENKAKQMWNKGTNTHSYIFCFFVCFAFCFFWLCFCFIKLFWLLVSMAGVPDIIILRSIQWRVMPTGSMKMIWLEWWANQIVFKNHIRLEYWTLKKA